MIKHPAFWASIIVIAVAAFAVSQTDTGRRILHLIATGEAL